MSWEAFACSAVWRMRLALIITCLFTVAALTASAIGLYNIRHAQDALRETAIPTLDRVEAVNDRLRLLEQMITTLRAARDRETFDRAAGSAGKLTDQLAELTTGQARIAALIRELQDALGKAREISTARFVNLAELRALREGAARQESALGQMIETYIAGTATTLETSLIDDSVPISTHDLAAGIAELGALTHLGFNAEKSGETVRALAHAQDTVEIGELKARLAFNLRSGITNLTQLSDPSQKAALAAILGGLRKDQLGQGGLVDHELARVEREVGFSAELLRLKTLIDTTSAEVAIGVTDARTGIRETAAAVDTVVDDTIIELAVLSVVILVLTGLTAILLVERQIIRRMNSLSGSVREIATGNTETEVEVHGRDEFGEMAQALEIFKRNTKELHRSNAELSRFAYAASHDLRSPLRAIRDLAQWTIEDAGDSLPGHCRENLELLIDRVDRLARLLGNLLDYSQVGREEASVELVDLRALPQEMVELLGVADRFSVVLTGNLVPVETYDAPLRQILLNLINNATKHHDRDTGQLTVDIRLQSGRMVISVSDDGPGIAPEFHERIFGLFETLKSRDEVEGSGMGLAIIRKQVECHGGAISVISDPAAQRGTTFVFDWPIHVTERDSLAAA